MKTKMKFGGFFLILFLIGVLPGLACQVSGLTPGAKATPANQSSVQIIPPEGSAPTDTPDNSFSIPILGIGGDEDTESLEATQPGNIQILGNNSEKHAVQVVNSDFEPVHMVEDLGDFSGETGVGKLLVVENPNTDLAIQNTRCQLSSYDISGAVLDTGICEIGLLFPGERRTIYVGMITQSTTKSAKLEFTITDPGEAVKTSLTSESLSTERVKYWPTEGTVTAMVKNNSEYLIDNPILTAIFYDAQDEIIAVGTDNAMGFVIPNGQSALSVSTPRDLAPARVELLAVPQGAWTISTVSAERPTLQVNKMQGFQDTSNYSHLADVILVVTNPNADYSLTGIVFQVAAYDAQGYILGTREYFSPVMFPGEQMALDSSKFSIPADSLVASVDVQVSPLVRETDLKNFNALGIPVNPLSVSNAVYKDGGVTCILKNSWKNEINGATVIVMAYDENGKIVGYGSNSVFPMPANGQTEIRVTLSVFDLNFSGTPARIEMYAHASMATDIR